MSKIEEEDDSQNPPSHVNQIIRANNFLINRLNGKYTPSKKSRRRRRLTEDSVKSEQVYREKESKRRLQISQPIEAAHSRERSKKSVFEKYNIPETKTVKQKNNRTSIRSKLSQCNSNQHSQTRALSQKRPQNEMHYSSNTIKKPNPGTMNLASESEQGTREQLENWGFKRVESSEINRELFKKKSLTRPLPAKISSSCRRESFVTGGLEREILNSEFSKIRFSNLNQKGPKVAVEGLKRGSLKPLTVHMHVDHHLGSKKSDKLNSVISLQDSDAKKKKSKTDILKKYGIAVGKKKRARTVHERGAEAGRRESIREDSRDKSEQRSESGQNGQLAESVPRDKVNSGHFEYMKLRSNEQLEMESRLPKELDKQFKKMMSMDIGRGWGRLTRRLRRNPDHE